MIVVARVMLSAQGKIVATGVALLLVSLGAPLRALACVVGTGTGTCDETALNGCLPGGGSFDGTVTFNCGGAATIPVTSTKTISATTTIDGGGLISISGGNSVGVFAVNNGVTFTVQNLTIENASNGGTGGGIYTDNGTVTVTDSTFTSNSSLIGGAIYNNRGALTVTGSTFSGNLTTAGVGGAIATGGTLTVANSTFFQNQGLFSAIWAQSATGTVTNSTFFQNFGGISVASATVTVTNSIIAASTIFGNCALAAGIIDGGHNIDDGNTCGFTGSGCTVTTGSSFCNTDPRLDPAGLASNGGPTQTIALCTNADTPVSCTGTSPAIDAGDQAVCAAAPVNDVDQRGVPRSFPLDPICDIGAFEVPHPGVPRPAPALSPVALLGLAALLAAVGWRKAQSASRAR